MLNKSYLFLAGEFNITMQVAFERDNWQHTMTAKKLVLENDGRLHRFGINENVKGLIYLADTDKHWLEVDNLKTIVNSGIPCWPNPETLARMSDRHAVMRECREFGLTTDPVWFSNESLPQEEGKYVVKIGQSHQGQDKFLANSIFEIKEIIKDQIEVATIERFYEGLSVRVLFIGDKPFGIQYRNDLSWIKNSVGGDFDDWALTPEIVAHAKKVNDHFSLEVSGVDYVVDDDGFHFLEVNQYPGLNMNDETCTVAKEFLRTKLDWIEKETVGK